MKYTFLEVTRCNMCNSSNWKILGRRLNKSQGFFPGRRVGITTTIMECRNCGLVFSNPMPIPDTLTDHYNLEVDAYFSKSLIEESNHAFEYELAYFKSLYPDNDRPKALDIGAGLGGIMNAMKKAGIDAFGLEPSRTFHDFAINRMGVEKDRLMNQSIEEANFNSNYFDFIVFSSVFEHLYDPNEALKKALMWLKPSGIILIGVPSSKSLNQILINTFHRLKFSDYVSNLSPMHSPFHLYEYTEESFVKNGKLNKYIIHRVDRVTYNTFLHPSFNWLTRPIIKMTKTDMSLIVWIIKNK